MMTISVGLTVITTGAGKKGHPNMVVTENTGKGHRSAKSHYRISRTLGT
jgi:hypothetical protein